MERTLAAARASPRRRQNHNFHDNVVFEAKAGPYRPHAPEERAPFAPAEDSPEARDYLARLRALFAGARGSRKSR
ncbi:MAG: hypothetical protein HY323_15995 [Betaproteobacteria bacterium]|nr:hypothetical protein [Betaproteobacteria bacterium]